ncbi:MAG TPA: NAD-dependent deacylase [Candidatus Eisenbacteria bacterium]|jgi:NAD-dependent deacetylase|nr:NAD-dependent deacylase [Candidatus Eisenbacteria bacterium]
MQKGIDAFPTDLIEALRNASDVCVLTGSGISAESGIPTFRDAQTGLWEKFKPEELATPEAFRQNPRRVWEWYAWRRELVAKAEPNAGHLALVELERRVRSFTLITQNVDGLHQRAGNRQVIELHGNITRTKCFEEDVVVNEWPETNEVPPRCPRCGGWLRPDVVWFGERLPTEAINTAMAATTACELFLSVGTSALVYPAASLPFDAIEQGATVVEINPDSTPLTSRAHHAIHSPAAMVLPALLRVAFPRAQGPNSA